MVITLLDITILGSVIIPRCKIAWAAQAKEIKNKKYFLAWAELATVNVTTFVLLICVIVVL